MLKRLLSVVFLLIVTAGLYVHAEGLQHENSSQENVFFAGDKSFVLLEENTKEEGCLVLARDFYGERTYNGPAGSWYQTTQKFDPADPQSLAYWLNCGDEIGFLASGGLPENMEDNILTHNWVTEAGHPKGNCPEEYWVQAKVVVPSVAELVRYSDKIGYADEFFNKGYQDKAGGSWWTRSGFPTNWLNYESFIRTVHADGSNRQPGAFGCWNGGELAVRPMFYLSWDFFKTTPIDLGRSGKNVIRFLKKVCSGEDMKRLYTNEQIISISKRCTVVPGWEAVSLKESGYFFQVEDTMQGRVLYAENTSGNTLRLCQSISDGEIKAGNAYTVTFQYKIGETVDAEDVSFTAGWDNGDVQKYNLSSNQWKRADIVIEPKPNDSQTLEMSFHLDSKASKLWITDFALTAADGAQVAVNGEWVSGEETAPVLNGIKYDSEGGKVKISFDPLRNSSIYYNCAVCNGQGEQVGCVNAAEGEMELDGNLSETLFVYSQAVDTQKKRLIASICPKEKEGQGFYPYASPAYTFQIEGNDQEFLLLDITGNDESKFFVMAKDYYGQRTFDGEGSCSFTVADEDNLAYWLNNTFLSEDYQGKKLPDSVISYIDKDHHWKVRDYRGTYTQNMSLAVLSQEELSNYRDKVGIIDMLYDNDVDLWWLRNAAGSKDMAVMNIASPEAWNRVNSWVSTGIGAVRPVFYLNREFFKNVRIDINQAGAGVLKTMAKEFKEQELLQVYSLDEIQKIQKQSEEPYITNYVYLNSENSFASDEDEASQMMVCIQGGEEEDNLNLCIAAYDVSGNLTGVQSITEKIMPYQKKWLILDCPPEDGELIKGFLWKEPYQPICDVMTIRSPITKARLSRAKDVNIFTDEEPLRFLLKADTKKELHYVIKDLWERPVQEGTFLPEKSQYEWKLPFPGYGYFTIELSYPGTEENVLASSIFCVVTNEDFSDVENSVFGVNAHMNHKSYGWKPELIDYMALMGARTVRVDYSWAYVEKEKGKYTISESEHLERIREHNMKINFVSGYVNPFYDNGQVPYTPEGIDGFVKYQDAVLEMLGDSVVELDVYNEFWGGFGSAYGGPAQSQVEYYYPLLKRTYEQLKGKYPNVQILGTSVLGERKGWYEDLLALGGADYMDGVYYHSYYTFNEVFPEKAVESEYQDFVHANQKAGVDKPLYMTETGASSYSGGVSEKEQAARLVRSYLLWMKNGVIKNYWYDFMDDGTKGTELEHNFGMIRSAYHEFAYTPKPAYVAYAVLARQLKGYQYHSCQYYGNDQESEEPLGIYCFTFQKSDQFVNVLWSRNAQTVSIQTAENMKITDMMGTTTEYGNTQDVMISSEPIYITGVIKMME